MMKPGLALITEEQSTEAMFVMDCFIAQMDQMNHRSCALLGSVVSANGSAATTSVSVLRRFVMGR